MLASRLAAVLVAAGSVGTAVALGQTASRPAPHAELRAVAGGGSVQVGNSRDGEAIVGARGLMPGRAVEGSVTIANQGDAAGEASLAPVDLADRPGPGGTPLSRQLVLAVTDSERGTLYTGALGAMPAVALGSFAPGEQRTYRIEASLPDAGNGAQGAEASVGFLWTLVGAEDAASAASTGAEAPQAAVRPDPPAGARRLTVSIKRAAPPSGRTVRLTVSCSRACRATIGGTFVGSRRLSLTTLERTLPSGSTAITLTLPRQARVTANARLALTVRATARDGARDTASADVRLAR